MDDGEVELSDHALILNSDSSSSVQPSLSSDSFLDDLLRNAQTLTCTHTHTCNPPGPDAAHTHTCYHTHTHVFPSKEDSIDGKSSVSKAQRPSGNREAVRKYREKKKAHTAYLEDEVKKLRLVNGELMRKLQRQAVLEAEASRLRALLVDLKGKVDVELGDFPFQKQCSNTNAVNTFGEGELQVPPATLASGLPGTSVTSNGIDGCEYIMPIWERNCQPTNVECPGNLSYVENARKCLQDSVPQ